MTELTSLDAQYGSYVRPGILGPCVHLINADDIPIPKSDPRYQQGVLVIFANGNNSTIIIPLNTYIL